MDITKESKPLSISDEQLECLISWEQSGLYNHLLSQQQIDLIKLKIQAFLELKEFRRSK